MQKNLLLAAALLLTTICNAQVTTKTEFTYIKNGFKDVIEKGSDIKNGYTFEPMAEDRKTSNCVLNVYAVFRANKSIAGYAIHTENTAMLNTSDKWYCMPAVNTVGAESYGWSEYLNEVNNMGNSERYAILYWMTYKFTFYHSQANKVEKKQIYPQQDTVRSRN